MRMNDETEARLSEARSRRRQNRECPLLIRDDGMLFPNVPLVAKKQNFRPYRGDPKASLQERLNYLSGYGQSRRRVHYDPSVDEAPFELSKASAEDIIAFAFEELGATLDPALPLPELRAECYRLSQLPDIQMPTANETASTSSGAARASAQGMMAAADYAASLGTDSDATKTRSRGTRRAGTAAV